MPMCTMCYQFQYHIKAQHFRQGSKNWFVYWYLHSTSYSTNLGKRTMFY